MTRLKTPYSGVPINVPDELVERYTSAGYTPTEEPKKAAPRKRASSKPAGKPEGDE